MKTVDEIKHLWNESFDDPREWVDAFFARVYSDEDVVALTKGGQIVSSMLLQRYEMLFHGKAVGISYVCGACTRRKQRGRGYMSLLMKEALRESYNRGDVFCTLIPADEALYDFYSRFGFATVFYTHHDRYTSLHPFTTEKAYFPVNNLFSPEVYESFRRLEEGEGNCRVLHDRRDFLNILDDNRLDGGYTAVVADEKGEISGVGFAVEKDGVVVVKEVLGRDTDSITGALRQLRGYYADKPFKVLATPREGGGRLYPRGMARVVNVEGGLNVIAETHPHWRCVVRARDREIEENNGVFECKDGGVRRLETMPNKVDFDVEAEVLTAMMFSSSKMGELLDFPSERPTISLMLD